MDQTYSHSVSQPLPGAGTGRARLRRLGLAGALALAPTFSYTAHAVIRNIQPNWGRLLMAVYMLALLTPPVYWLLFRFALPRLRAWPPRRRAAALAAALLAALLLMLLIPVPRPELLRLHRLEISALVRRGPSAQASQVWVLELRRPDGTAVPLADLQQEGTWELQDGKLGALGPEPASLRWEGYLVGEPSLRLLTHAWSGLALVRWDGHAQTVDLFSDPPGEQTLRLPADQGPPTQREAALYALTFAADTLTLALLALLAGLWLSRGRPRLLRR